MNEQQDRAGIKRNWPEYENCGILGHGAYGQVYKIKREYLGNTLYSALKVVHIPPNENMQYEMEAMGMSEAKIKEYYKKLVENFLNENSVMEKLKGASNIVTIEDCIVEGDADGGDYTIYIKMELLESLESMMRKFQFGPDDIVTMGKDICDALIACEHMNVIHRDIKPANIFINSFGTFKLGDFGVAKQMQHTRTNMTQIGTGMYMAPELYRGEAADRRVDIYSLGITLYRIANQGCFPFVNPNTMNPESSQDALIKRIRGDELPLPSQVPPELGRIIVKACAHKPEDRYDSAREFREALEIWSARQKYKDTFLAEGNGKEENEKEGNVREQNRKAGDKKEDNGRGMEPPGKIDSSPNKHPVINALIKIIFWILTIFFAILGMAWFSIGKTDGIGYRIIGIVTLAWAVMACSAITSKTKKIKKLQGYYKHKRKIVVLLVVIWFLAMMFL